RTFHSCLEARKIMRQVLWPISVVIALVAGVVIGLALGSSSTAPGAAPKADTQSASAARQPTLPVAPAVPAEEESLPLADESSADLRQGGAQISEALLADLFPTGDAAIWGEVRTADGEPLPGVKISARRMSKPQ